MRKTLFLAACILLVSHMPANSQTLPSGFSLTNIGNTGGAIWNIPIGAAFTQDGLRLFVWEKGGRVYVCNRNSSGNYIKQSTPVLDISAEVLGWRDHGLSGFALDPNFTSNGLIYLLYAVDRRFLMNDNSIPADYSNYTGENKATLGRVTRYKTIINGSGNLVIDAATRKILIGETPSTGIPLLHESHGMGTLAFASDGTLLASAGDGASYNTTDGGSVNHTYYVQALADGIIRPAENVGAFKSQMLNSHNGKLLRIDPATGDGISSNPFFSAAEPRSPKSRVWALGFRNPFRFSIRPGTGSANPSAGDIGEIYVGDVGWGTYEETSIIKSPGMNCGWPLYEGHTTLNSYMNLTTTNQDELNPLYGITGCSRQYFRFKELLKQATADNITAVYNPCNASELIGTSNRYFHRRPAIDWRHVQNEARVGIFNGNNAAVAMIGTPESNVVGAPFPGNCAVAGVWYTGDAFPAGYKNTFLQADYGGQWIKRITIDYTDVVTGVDNFGSGFSEIVCITQNPLDGTLITVQPTNTGVKKISYGGNQLPVVKISANKIYGTSPLAVNFTGNTSFDPDNNNPITYSWNYGDPGSGTNTSTSANPSHTFTFASGPKKYVVKLTVTDNLGASSTDSIIISINNTPPVVNITSPINNSTYLPGADTIYALSATVTDAEHNQGQLKYAWQTFLRHNNHEHAEQIDTTRNTGTSISRIGCNGDSYYWHVELTVTDAAGLSTIDSSQIFPACASAPLPVVLRKFSVTQRGNENLIKWTTESEMNIEYFEVERSTDPFNFVPISQKPARNTSGPNEYSFTDNGFSAGVNYYRLKMVETGAVTRYSLIVKTASEIKHEELVISPNPVTGNFSVSYSAAENGPVIIRISDISGRLVNTIHESVNRGQNIIYLQSLPAWKPGMYLISVQQANDIQHGKLIKAE